MTIETPCSERAAEIRKAVTAKYREVAKSPAGHFAYPVGIEGALKLSYDSSWIELVPSAVANRFVGAGNPFSIRTPKSGDHC